MDEQEAQNDYLPISALQHFAYCQRQFALIHVEQIWAENRYTAEGQVLHERANSGDTETRGKLHVARTLRLVSHGLKLTGIADVVEFHQISDGPGASLPGLTGLWRPYPVEYKRGRSKDDDWDRLQLCAQAICLEEMLEVAVPEGALFYGKPRRREVVAIDSELRGKTRTLTTQMYQLWGRRLTPPPEPGPKCERCSLRQRCLPEQGSASAYLQRMLDE